MTTFQSSDFRAPSKMKVSAYKSPAYITEHGEIRFVLMTISEFNEMKSKADKYDSGKQN